MNQTTINYVEIASLEKEVRKEAARLGQSIVNLRRRSLFFNAWLLNCGPIVIPHCIFDYMEEVLWD